MPFLKKPTIKTGCKINQAAHFKYFSCKMMLFKVNLMVTKVKPSKSENKYIHLITHPCIPSKEGNNRIYFLIYSVIHILLWAKL